MHSDSAGMVSWERRSASGAERWGKMASGPALHIRLSRVATAIILCVFATTGLFAGLASHALTNQQLSGTLGTGPVVSGSPPAQAAPTGTSAPVAATVTPTLTNNPSAFVLSITLSQRAVTAGETFTVTVVAAANGAPASGLSCTLRAPTGGPPGLLTMWPAPVTTDANGQAVWTLTTPSVSPGIYGIEVDAIGAHRYEFHRYTSLQVH